MTRCCLVAALLIVTASTPSHSRTPERESDRLVTEARKAFNAADFQGAITRYEQAVSLTEAAEERAAIRCELGATYATLDKRKQAIAQFRTALIESPTVAPKAGRTNPSVLRLFDRVRAQVKGTLEVSSEMPGTIWVDEQSLGPAPQAVEIAVGSHRVEIRDAGGKPLDAKTVTVPHQKTAAVRFTAPEAPRRPRLWTWVALGTAAAAAAIGIGFGVSADSAFNDYKESTDPDEREQLKSRVSTHGSVANAMYLTGGILFLGAIALYFTEPYFGTADSQPGEISLTDTTTVRLGPVSSLSIDF